MKTKRVHASVWEVGNQQDLFFAWEGREVNFMKKKTIATVLPILLLALGIGYVLVGNLTVAYHNYQFKQAILSINSEETTLNEVVPFAWDTVYTFSPYTGKDEIERVIGFRSRHIRETVSEDMVQLLFVKDGSVTASICGYGQNLGYRVSFADSVAFQEKAVFRVRKESAANTTVLTKIPQQAQF